MEHTDYAVIPAAIILGIFILLAGLFAGEQVKLGIRTAACINMSMSGIDCAAWNTQWDHNY